MTYPDYRKTIQAGTVLIVRNHERSCNLLEKGQLVMATSSPTGKYECGDPVIYIATYPERIPIKGFWYVTRFEILGNLIINKQTITL